MVVEIAQGVQCIAAPSMTIGPGRHTNVYLIGSTELVMVDPGHAEDKDVDETLDYLASLGNPKLREIIITHSHKDHYQAAKRIREATGAKIRCHPQSAPYVEKGLGSKEVELHFNDGDVLEVDGLRLEAIHTPGHSPGHVCIYLPAERILLTGDLIVGEGTVVIGPPEGDLYDYMDSLRRLLTFDVELICPGHGPMVKDPRTKIYEYINHRLLRELQVLTAVEKGIETIPEMVKDIYWDVDKSLHKLAEGNVLAHLMKLEKENRVAVADQGEGKGKLYTLKQGR